MNFLFFEHPNRRERVNLMKFMRIQLEKSVVNKRPTWHMLFFQDAFSALPMEWRFKEEVVAEATFEELSALMSKYLYAIVLPDFIICKEYVEAANVTSTEDGWSFVIHLRDREGVTEMIHFPAESEDGAMELYKMAFSI